MIPSTKRVHEISLPSDSGSPKTVFGVRPYAGKEDQIILSRMQELRRAIRTENPAITETEIAARVWDLQWDDATERLEWVRHVELADGTAADELRGKDAREWATTMPAQAAYEFVALAKSPPSASAKRPAEDTLQGKESASPPK